MTIVYSSASWNYQIGCSATGAGCAHCFAARQASTRLAHVPDYQGLAQAGKWTGMLRVRGDKKWFEPLRARRPRVYFVNSTSDTFHENRDPAWVARAWAIMAMAHWHTFLILSKRLIEAIEQLTDRGFYAKVLEWANEIRSQMPPKHPCQQIAISDPSIQPLHNVWFGASASTQRELAWVLEHIGEVPARMRWVSLEPMIEQIDIVQASEPFRVADLLPVDWVVAGAESGPKARVFDLAWGRRLITDCASIRLPLYFKQTGSNASDGGKPFRTKHPKGEDPKEWPAELKRRQIPMFAQTIHHPSTCLVYTDELG